MVFALPADAVAAGYGLTVFDATGSTNFEAMARAMAGEAGPAWFVTDRQMAGVGRRGSAWQTPHGNLAASLLLTTELPPAAIAQLGFVAGLALADALERCCDGSVFSLKWPNDVLADEAKLAGILLGTEALPAVPGQVRRAVAVGIGVNVVVAPGGLPYPAASLHGLGHSEVEADTLFAELASAWIRAHRLWDEGRGFPAVRTDWLGRAAGLGRAVAVKTGERIAQGVFETIDEHGQLLMRTPDGAFRTVSAGEVHFGEAASFRGDQAMSGARG